MTSKVLTNFLDKCYYDSATERFYVESGMDGFLNATLSAYLGNDGIDPEGEQFNIKVIQDKANETDATVWEEMNASYHNASGTIYFERQSTVASSTGDDINFDAKEIDGDSNLTMYGVTGVQHFGGIRQVRYGIPPRSPEYEILAADSETDYFDASDSRTITPLNSSAYLIVDIEGYEECRIGSGSSIGHEIFLSYLDDGGTFTRLDRVFYTLHTSHTENISRHEAKFRTMILTQDHLNLSGNWQFKLTQKKTYAPNYARLIDATLDPTQVY